MDIFIISAAESCLQHATSHWISKTQKIKLSAWILFSLCEKWKVHTVNGQQSSPNYTTTLQSLGGVQIVTTRKWLVEPSWVTLGPGVLCNQIRQNWIYVMDRAVDLQKLHGNLTCTNRAQTVQPLTIDWINSCPKYIKYQKLPRMETRHAFLETYPNSKGNIQSHVEQ